MGYDKHCVVWCNKYQKRTLFKLQLYTYLVCGYYHISFYVASWCTTNCVFK